MPRAPHTVLGVVPDASAAEIRAAYKRLALTWHPDLNKSREAGERMAEVNAAFDAMTSGRSAASADSAGRGSPPPGSPPPSPTGMTEDELRHTVVACERCGRDDVTLRVSVMVVVRSFLLATWRNGEAALLCEECRGSAALRANAQSAMLGWWSVPGLVVTPLEAFRNARGGRQSKEVNDDVLLALAETRRAQGDSAGNEDALHERLAVHDSSDGRGDRGRLRFGATLLSLIPTLVVGLGIIAGITAIAMAAPTSPSQDQADAGALAAARRVVTQDRAVMRAIPTNPSESCRPGLVERAQRIEQDANGSRCPSRLLAAAQSSKCSRSATWLRTARRPFVACCRSRRLLTPGSRDPMLKRWEMPTEQPSPRSTIGSTNTIPGSRMAKPAGPGQIREIVLERL